MDSPNSPASYQSGPPVRFSSHILQRCQWGEAELSTPRCASWATTLYSTGVNKREVIAHSASYIDVITSSLFTNYISSAWNFILTYLLVLWCPSRRGLPFMCTKMTGPRVFGPAKCRLGGLHCSPARITPPLSLSFKRLGLAQRPLEHRRTCARCVLLQAPWPFSPGSCAGSWLYPAPGWQEQVSRPWAWGQKVSLHSTAQSTRQGRAHDALQGWRPASQQWVSSA